MKTWKSKNFDSAGAEHPPAARASLKSSPLLARAQSLSRRDRLCNIIRALSRRNPRFEVVVGNNCPVSPFPVSNWVKGPDTLRYLTEEGLEITARFLIRDRAATNRNNERNRLARLAQTAK